MESESNRPPIKAAPPTIGRKNCLRDAVCRARACPLEPWNKDLKRLKTEQVCFYLREAERAGRSSESRWAKGSNPDTATEARRIAGHTKRTYFLSLSPSNVRSSENQGPAK